MSSENEQLCEPGSCDCVMSTTEKLLLPAHSFVNEWIAAAAASARPNVASQMKAMAKSETGRRCTLSHRELRRPCHERASAVIDRERERVIARRQSRKRARVKTGTSSEDCGCAVVALLNDPSGLRDL